MKKIKPLSITFNGSDIRNINKKLKKTLGEAIYTKFKRILNREKKILKNHFKSEGWDLDARIINDSIYNELLGVDLSLIIMLEMCMFSELVLDNNQWLFRKKGKYAVQNKKTKR